MNRFCWYVLFIVVVDFTTVLTSYKFSINVQDQQGFAVVKRDAEEGDGWPSPPSLVIKSDDSQPAKRRVAEATANVQVQTFSMEEFYKGASFFEKNFIYFLMTLGVMWGAVYLYCLYECLCGKGMISVCPCCKTCIYKVANKGVVGADIDEKGNIKYRSVTDADMQDIALGKEILGFIS